MYIQKTYIFILLIFIFPLINIAQNINELGQYSIHNFSTEEYNNAQPQNWAIVQDQRGILYFGNSDGVLIYDGIYWRLIKVTNESHIKSLSIDNAGKVYVGATGEFGFLEPNSHGEIIYRSLVNKIPEKDKIFYDIWSTISTSKGIFFQTSDNIFLWNNDTIKVFLPKSKFTSSFKIKDRFFVHQPNDLGFTLIEKDSMKQVKGSETFTGKRINSIIPVNDSLLFFVTRENGIYSVFYNEKTNTIKESKYVTDIEKYTKQFYAYSAEKLGINKISIGTRGTGAIILYKNDIIQFIDKFTGLQDEIIQYQYLDKNKNLWLALSDGISKVEVNSPISIFNDKNGLNGTIESITRFNNKLYIATSLGVYYLTNETSQLNSSNKSKYYYSFRPVNSSSEESWKLITYKTKQEELLLVVLNDRVVEIDKNHNIQIILKDIPWSLLQSNIDKNRVFVGIGDGIKSIYRKNKTWIEEGKIEGINERIENIHETESGDLWLGTEKSGVIKIGINSFKINEPKANRITLFDTINGLPDNGPYFAIACNNKILFATGNGIYSFNKSFERFELDTTFPASFKNCYDKYIHRMAIDNKNKLWLVTYDNNQLEIGYLKPNKVNWEWVNVPFLGIKSGSIHGIFHDKNNITWLGGSEGLYRFDGNISKNYKPEYNTLIRKVIIGTDSVIFGGNYFDENNYTSLKQPDILKPVLEFVYNSIEFQFSAQNTEVDQALYFSYYLEGYDKEWSEWTKSPERYYTNLPEGDYNFRVKAKNIFNHESKEGTYEFTILPPWYRTIVAYFVYLIFLVLFIWLIVKLNVRRLQQEKIRLEGIVCERTAEVVAQKEEIEEKNKHIMDSIYYAKRIQNALLPPKEMVSKALPEHFILFKPRDIVSGDYYWLGKTGGNTVIVAADCTGHGVPGAFMSMLGVAFLNEIVSKSETIMANEILNQLREHVMTSLRQTGKEGEAKDGMDMALCIIDHNKMKLQFSGANNPLYLIRNKELIQYKADRMPIGIYIKTQAFENTEIQLEKDDSIYIFSDGFVDQFGGEKGRKFKSKPFKKLLVDIQDKTMKEQYEILDNTIEDWKGPVQEQIDDILVIGIKI
ncbi:MAG: SpoIIE family protein phosphatase [Bacteroidales bacterium]|nr:SpoIIE family protein phosphatase [Bacteroidales bacterium]